MEQSLEASDADVTSQTVGVVGALVSDAKMVTIVRA
jgi:hypothetical protein